MKRKESESLRALTLPELESELEKRRRKLFELRFQRTFHQAKNPLELRLLGRDIARIMTWIHEQKARAGAAQ